MIGYRIYPALRVTHAPTGEVVTVERTRPAHTWTWARARALAILRGRLWELAHGAGRSPAVVADYDLSADPPAGRLPDERDLLALRAPIGGLHRQEGTTA